MNNWNITGNLGKDCRTAQVGQHTVCNFALAVKSGFGDRQQTLWVDCALWGKQAESKLVQYLVKGQQVALSGEVGTKEHEGKVYLTLKVSSIDLIGSAAQNSNQQAPQQQQNNPTYQKPQQQQSPAQSAPMAEPNFDFDDDISF
jgi:single-strand DNA-binding protein